MRRPPHPQLRSEGKGLRTPAGCVLCVCLFLCFVGAWDQPPVRPVCGAEVTSDVALELDGDGDYVDLGVSAADLQIEGNRPKTVEMQVLVREFKYHEGIFSLGRAGATGEDFSLRVRGGRAGQFRAQFWARDVDFEVDARNRWVHIAIVHDGESQTVYADGHEVGAAEQELNPTVTLHDEAFEFFRAAARFMDPGSPRWHRTKLREARALVLVRDAGAAECAGLGASFCMHQ
ncbi:MAG: LamG-like jellyroll fold domain-containing protein [Planctomycetota bacterium]